MPNNHKYTPFLTLGALAFIGLCFTLIIHLTNITTTADTSIASSMSESSLSLNKSSTSQESTTIDNSDSTQRETIAQATSIDDLLIDYSPSKKSLNVEAAEIVKNTYDGNVLEAQDDILKAIQKNRLNAEELGYLFLPKEPSSYTPIRSNQIDVPLYLQKDAKWRTTKYGDATTQQLGENGCAILSLAMVHATYEKRDVTPQEILNWSKERYWVDDAGTSWEIFYDFSQHFGYNFYNYGNDFHSAMTALEDGEVIVASVEPGYFTTVGHIIVIRGYENGKVYVNDPNDDVAKMYSIQGIDESILLAEGVNYWALSK